MGEIFDPFIEENSSSPNHIFLNVKHEINEKCISDHTCLLLGFLLPMFGQTIQGLQFQSAANRSQI